MPVRRHESERSYMCVLEVSMFASFYGFGIEFWKKSFKISKWLSEGVIEGQTTQWRKEK